MTSQKSTSRSIKLTIRRINKNDGKTLLSLIKALAAYEHLKPPDKTACSRLLKDGFGTKKKFNGYLAFADKKPVGYAIIFETYSSFLALPTLYLEDIFILPGYRSQGIGRNLFNVCLMEAKRRGCGRMEWVVLDWNKPAINFYRKIGARQLREWMTFRIDKNNFDKILSCT